MKLTKSHFLLLSGCIISFAAFGQFGSQNQLTFSNYVPSAILSADIDADGDEDAIAASGYDGKVCWYENIGNGNFKAEKIVGQHFFGNPSDIQVADLDGDGDIDVAASCSSSDKIIWFQNTGDGSFAAFQVISNTADNASSVNTADIDNDGDSDVFSTSSGDNKIAWYENLGSGNFGPQQIISTQAGGASSAEIVDIDNDGRYDILTSCKAANKIVWSRNLGNGTFAPIQSIATNTFDVTMSRCADLDMDGDQDIYAAFENNLVWYENSGSGVFNSQQVIAVNPGFSGDILSSDIDGDGDPELVATLRASNTVMLYVNDGNGVFSSVAISVTAKGCRHVWISDLNADGLKDVLYCGSTVNPNWENEIAWIPQLPGNSFGAKKIFFDEANSAWFVTTADINGDGAPDILSASSLDNKVAWYENQGDNFGEQKIISQNAEQVRTLDVSDLDNDGDLDVIFTDYSNYELLWQENLGSGIFGPEHIISTSIFGYFCSINSLDVDEDGDTDVFVSSHLDNSIAFYENIGQGIFASEQLITDQAMNCRSIKSGDLDFDGNKDIISANNGNGRIMLYKGLGNNQFDSGEVVISSLTQVMDVNLADIDNDGDADIAAVSSVPGKVLWLENEGNGSFIIQHFLDHSLDEPYSVSSADIDNDNDIDLAVISYGSGSQDEAVWFENLGGGSYSQQQLISNQLGGGTSIHTRDLDGDGDVEVVTASLNDDKIAWFENYIIHENQASGKLFIDINQSSSLDHQDLPFVQTGIVSSPPASASHIFADGRFFFIYEDTNVSRTITPVMLTNWELTTDSASYTVNSGTTCCPSDSLDFGFYPSTIFTDISTDITGGFPRCNNTVNFWLNFSNTGTSIPSGTIALTLDDSVEYLSSNLPPDSISGQIIYWSYDSLLYFESDQINVHVMMPDFQSMDDTLLNYYSIFELDNSGDVLYQSSDTLRQILLCAYDPNDKTAEPAGIDEPGYIPMETTTIDYLIRFQNTGNDTSQTVVIKDQLDQNLDWSTCSIISSSHQMEWTRSTSGQLTFFFSDVFLPDSSVNFLGSQGFVKFRVSLYENLPSGRTITNSANIYFDLNPAVVTNTKTHTLYDCGNFMTSIPFSSQYCAMEPISLEGGLSSTYFEWELSTAGSGSGYDVNFQPDTTGTFAANFHVDNQICSADTTFFITISEPVALTLLAPLFICDGDSVLLFSEYRSSPGIYYDTIQTPAGCDSVISVNLTVLSPAPYHLDQTICLGDSVMFNGNVYSTAGDHEIVLQTEQGCDSITFLHLTINAPNTFVELTDVVLTASADNALYEWIDCENGQTLGNSQSYIPFYNGSFSVIITQNSCSDTSECYTVDLLQIEKAIEGDWTIYPNPTKDLLYITPPTEFADDPYKIYDESGRILRSGNLVYGQTSLSLADIQPGSYQFEVGFEKRRFKLVKL